MRKTRYRVDQAHPLKVCYFGTYRDKYNRNQMMIAGLRANGVEVYECHVTLWHGIEDRVQTVSGGWIKPVFWGRIIKAYLQLIQKYYQLADHDVLVVGYPGQLDVILARILAWVRRKPLAWDVLMSIYLVSVERGLEKENRISIQLLHLLEGLALKLPDMLIIDTRTYADWFCKNYKLRPDRFRLVPIGADDRVFFPMTDGQPSDDKITVLYAGSFIPNHGVNYIVEAAQWLIGEPNVKFELIGEGPDLEFARQFVERHQLRNVRFYGWMDKIELTERIKQASICLGTFGTTPQSMMTVQNKIYETLAMAKPLINGESPAIKLAFKHGEHMYLCKRADGKAIADAIVALWKDPALRETMAQNGYRLFRERYSLSNNGKRYETFLRELIH